MSLRLAASLGLGSLCGCAALALQPGMTQDPVQVREVEARFLSEERADFRLLLDIDNVELVSGSVRSLEWEVWIGRRWFAAGRQALAAPLPKGHRDLAVDVPVVFQRTPVVAGAVPLELGVRGKVVVDLEGSERRLPFQRTLVVSSDGAPVFTGEED